MKIPEHLKKPALVATTLLALLAIILSFLVYRNATMTGESNEQPTPTSTPTLAPSPTPTPTPTVPATPTIDIVDLPFQSPDKILGIESSPGEVPPGIKWVRLSYPSCGWGDLRGERLRTVINDYHKQDVRVLLLVCQGPNNDDSKLFDQGLVDDAAQGRADAYQCGNEQMKQDASVAFLYINPEKFARFYNMCSEAVHKVRADTPTLVGSLDPMVASNDEAKMRRQVAYLDTMQKTMNESIRPGSNWAWRNERIGIIDSWHNGYPSASVNNVEGILRFWGQQFNVSPDSGKLGEHLWLTEATGCFRGCGVPNNAKAIAVSHIFALIVDAQTAVRYHVPHFFFSSKDFVDQGISWPIGVLDIHGQPKPLRQDLPMGAKVLSMECGGQREDVREQLVLLEKLYANCQPPANYRDILQS